ncbi:helix-turn-helix domain-containing protein [Natronomonas sp. F2-12]|jgi:predicted DNA binding protein|uniref:Helix-turn-helix domain-containing protein n=1 Tax=Natronomonas aquatica TaxID=2841590 RepID=A0A9R1CRU3_9EURY|nr:helix-turn-helix domain-containing protein [Natronomonas aquatica]MCQ4332658.1 helix-turn-helix domain-containing protein [Natronomonas aquatica]
MGSGIRAEIRVDADGTCPVVEGAVSAGSPSYSIVRSTTADGADRIVEEFMIDSDGAPTASRELTKVFDYGSKSMYRFDRKRGRGCPCESIEAFDCPIVDLHTRDGSLYLVFHADDMETLRGVIATLKDRYPEVDVRRLLRSEHDRQESNLIFVDRGRLTDRQREVLETAHRMGYFEHPKAANAGEVAEALGITTATFSEHLAAAQSKLLDAILDV